MNHAEQRLGDIPTSDRMKTLGTAMASNLGQQASGEGERDQQSGCRLLAGVGQVEAFISDWPAGPVQAARL